MSKVISGVPQGSGLGPILFIIYVNDLEDVLSNKATFKLFADDLKLSHPLISHRPMSTCNMLLIYWSSGQHRGSYL